MSSRIHQYPRLRQVLRPVADGVLRTYGLIRARTTYDIRNTIAVAATGRGGSTWLAELLAEISGYTMIWEPLHLANNPACQSHGFDWNTYLPVDASFPQQYDYLRRVLTGANLSTRLVTSLEFQPSRLFVPGGGYLVKFVNANLLFPWMMDRFPVSGVLLVRHPCAVVASQIKHGAWGHVTKDNYTRPEALFEEHPHLAAVFESVTTQEELLAFAWAVQTYVPLSVPPPRNWHTVTYEHLVADGPSTIDDLFDALGRPVPSSVYDELDTPSATASSHLQAGETKSRLETWRRRLSTSQIDQILRVAHDVGVTFYTDDLLPSGDLLASPPDHPRSSS